MLNVEVFKEALARIAVEILFCLTRSLDCARDDIWTGFIPCIWDDCKKDCNG